MVTDHQKLRRVNSHLRLLLVPTTIGSLAKEVVELLPLALWVAKGITIDYVNLRPLDFDVLESFANSPAPSP